MAAHAFRLHPSSSAAAAMHTLHRRWVRCQAVTVRQWKDRYGKGSAPRTTKVWLYTCTV